MNNRISITGISLLFWVLIPNPAHATKNRACATTICGMCHNFLWHAPQLFVACASTFWGMCHNFSGHVQQLFVACATTFQGMCQCFSAHVPQLFVANAPYFVACDILVTKLFGACAPYFKACSMLITTAVDGLVYQCHCVRFNR